MSGIINTQVLIGNCAEVLKALPSESVDCCVTSPPYWGLRDYKTEPLVWDAVEGCEHEWGDEIKNPKADNRTREELLKSGSDCRSTLSMESWNPKTNGCFCARCGAWRGQLGLEPTPQLYIQHLVGIFDEVKRVLKPSGTCWVNLGDSYGDKSLVQVPSRFAIAMTDRGWILRNELIWHKKNCMPSSVKDRFTVDFEKFYFFVKSPRYYFETQYDPLISEPHARGGNNDSSKGTYQPHLDKRTPEDLGWPNRVWGNERGRNKRTVWTISTKPYSGAHFAVFPPELVETPIKAGCPEFICSKCGEPRKFLYDKSIEFTSGSGKSGNVPSGKYEGSAQAISGDYDIRMGPSIARSRTGLTDCGCGAPFVPGVVLDPFGGSGTTGEVARSLGRSSIMIELNPEYIQLVKDRARTDVPDVLSFDEAVADE